MQALIILTKSVESNLGLFTEEWCIHEECSRLNSVQNSHLLGTSECNLI